MIVCVPDTDTNLTSSVCILKNIYILQTIVPLHKLSHLVAPITQAALNAIPYFEMLYQDPHLPLYPQRDAWKRSGAEKASFLYTLYFSIWAKKDFYPLIHRMKIQIFTITLKYLPNLSTVNDGLHLWVVCIQTSDEPWLCVVKVTDWPVLLWPKPFILLVGLLPWLD